MGRLFTESEINARKEKKFVYRFVKQFVKIEIPDGPEVNFSGYIINAEGSRQDLKFIKANTDFPVPTNLTDLTSLMGLVNRFTEKRRKTLP
mgnify:CR=1 FL=1